MKSAIHEEFASGTFLQARAQALSTKSLTESLYAPFASAFSSFLTLKQKSNTNLWHLQNKIFQCKIDLSSACMYISIIYDSSIIYVLVLRGEQKFLQGLRKQTHTNTTSLFTLLRYIVCEKILVIMAGYTWAATKFLATCSLIFHTRNTFVTLWVHEFYQQQAISLSHSIKGNQSYCTQP